MMHSHSGMSGIGHVSLGTNDLARARVFYDAVLTPLGLTLIAQDHASLDYGVDGVLFSLETPVDSRRASAGNGVHVAFVAPSRATVDAFHAEAIRRGGHDAGGAALRLEYGPNYYAAFVLDPDGNKIEAFTERPE